MSTRTWHLIKTSTQEKYGPLSHEDLMQLAAEAKISPMDRLSDDGGITWLRAPMVKALQMDWLIQMLDQYLYGPTNIATIQEFLASGQIDGHVTLIHCVTGKESRLQDQAFYRDSPQHVRSAQTTWVGARWPSSERSEAEPHALQRIRFLEGQLVQAQQALDEAQLAYQILRQQFREQTGQDPR